ncbi:hypothetical protein BDZ89DRAFT_70014 [Hymenopellis radicata]|nr:hypothetical protein BDZ89DRAFT_70014 [Hymenopellis radicata]
MSPTTYKVVREWEDAQIAERSDRIYTKRTAAAGSPSTSTLPVYKSDAGSTAHHSDVASTRSTVAPSTRSAPSFVNDMGVDSARYSTRADGSSRFSIDSIDISESRPASPSQFSDDFKPLPALPSFPEPPPYSGTRPYSTSSYSNNTANPTPSSLLVPGRTPLRHTTSAPESVSGVWVTVDTIREIV